MKQHRVYRVRLLLGVITLTLFAGHFSVNALGQSGAQKSGRTKRVSRGPRVPVLRDINQLKEAFQRDSGKVRLVALLSPT